MYLLVGECYLTDWTVWSPCQLSCVSGDDLGFGSVQVRSRAVVAQDPENLLQCPEQELEARPCTGQSDPRPGTRFMISLEIRGNQSVFFLQTASALTSSGEPGHGEARPAPSGVSAQMDSMSQVGLMYST